MASTNGISRGPSTASAQFHGDSRREGAKKAQAPRLVSQLTYPTLSKLSTLLDTSRDGTQAMWRRLIEEMPHLKYDLTTVEKFALNANRPNGSPAYALLTDMSNKGVAYDELITGLKKLDFFAALSAIGYREAVSFTVQPAAVPASVGQSVTLECETTGVPRPSYLWFKGREPLPDQTTCRLTIDKVTLDDSGQYCCRASNEVNVKFSSWAEIKVTPPKVMLPGIQVLPGTQDVTASPQIIQGPSGDYHVNINDEFHLVVVAVAPQTQELSYQWFRDGQLMPYAAGNELYIPHVQLSDQGSYTCRVSTKLGGSKLTDASVLHVITQQDGGVPQMGVPQMGVAQVPQQHQPVQPMHPHTAMQQQINYGQAAQGIPQHPGMPPGPAGGMPPGQAGGMPPPAGGIIHTNQVTVGGVAVGGGSVDSLSTHTTELLTSPGSQPSPYYDLPAPHPFAHEGVRPHDLPLYSHGVGGSYHHGNNTGDTSRMYHNEDIPVGEQVDFRQAHFPTITGSEDLMCGQGELRPNLNEPCYDKVALLIGNKNYHRSSLKLNTPENDAQDLAGVLRSAGFKVVSLVNLIKVEMEMALQYFACLVGKNVYALFFFAGHGFELNSKNYMMAVDADVEKRTDQCICAQNVLHMMQSRGAKLSIVLLDMCRVNASTPLPPGLEVLPPPKGTNGYFVIGFSCSPAEKAFEAGTSPEGSITDSKYKDNSIFVAALREHLQQGTLNKRIDNLLSDAAAGVRRKGQQLQQYDQWQKPEVRTNLGENLSLSDPTKQGRDIDSKRDQRALFWQRAHTVPDSVVVSCHGDAHNLVKPGEVAFRLHFEAEHSNVLLVTAELLTGCLSRVEILNISRMELVSDIHLRLPASNDKQYQYSEKSKYNYGHQGCRNNDLLHFKIPDIQKIKSAQVILEMEVEYIVLGVPGEARREKTCIIRHAMTPPLYAQVLSEQIKGAFTQHQQQLEYIHQFGVHGHTHNPRDQPLPCEH